MFLIRERLYAHPVTFIACGMQQFALGFERDSVCVTSCNIAESDTKFLAVFFTSFAEKYVICGSRKTVSVISMDIYPWRNETHRGKKGFPGERSATTPLWAPYVPGVYTWV